MRRACLILLFIIPLAANGQQSHLGNWLMYFGNSTLGTDWNWHHEVQHRNYNAIGDLEQLLLRTGMGYNLSENNNNILLGYAYILSQNYLDAGDDKMNVNEHRVYQQYITRQGFNRFSIQHRYRFEQRFIEDDFRLRLRYFLSVNIALSNSALADQTFYFSAYNEIFLNTEEGNVFDRNRVYGGLGYKINSALRLELGYMNQFLANGDRDQLNMICFVSF